MLFGSKFTLKSSRLCIRLWEFAAVDAVLKFAKAILFLGTTLVLGGYILLFVGI